MDVQDVEENLEISNTNTNTLGQLSKTLATGLSHGAMKKKITQDVMEQRGETEPQTREDKHGNYRNAKTAELRFNYPELEPLEQEEYPSNNWKLEIETHTRLEENQYISEIMNIMDRKTDRESYTGGTGIIEL